MHQQQQQAARTCPKCHTLQATGATTCRDCGDRLPPELRGLPGGLPSGGMPGSTRPVAPTGALGGDVRRRPAGKWQIVVEANLESMVREVIRAIADAPERQLYRQGRRLVKVVGADVVEWTRESALVDVSGLADFVMSSANGQRKVPPPRDLIAGILARGEWPTLRELRGVARVPIIHSDGTLVLSGYDPITKLFCALDVEIELPEERDQTLGEAIKASQRLLRHISSSRFTNGAGRSVWLSLLLTLVGRTLLETVPAHSFEAASAAVGKSTAVQIAAGLVFGRRAATENADLQASQVDKCAPFWAKSPLVFFDNVVNGGAFGSPQLDALLTSTDGRVRGFFTQDALPFWLGLTTFAATGNNIRFSGDMGSRVLRARMLPHAPRRFDPEDPSYYSEHRREVLEDALLILLAYLRSGRPSHGRTPHRFTSWDNIIRGAILWLGLADPVIDSEPSDDEEETLAACRALVASLGVVGSQTPTFTAAKLFDDIAPETHRSAVRLAEAKLKDRFPPPEAQSELDTVLAESERAAKLLAQLGSVLGKPITTAVYLGRALAKLRDRTVRGLDGTAVTLRRAESSRSSSYWVEWSESEQPQSEQPQSDSDAYSDN